MQLRQKTVFHELPVLYSVDLKEGIAMSALAPETSTATFVGALESAGATIVRAARRLVDEAIATSVERDACCSGCSSGVKK